MHAFLKLTHRDVQLAKTASEMTQIPEQFFIVTKSGKELRCGKIIHIKFRHWKLSMNSWASDFIITISMIIGGLAAKSLPKKVNLIWRIAIALAVGIILSILGHLIVKLFRGLYQPTWNPISDRKAYKMLSHSDMNGSLKKNFDIWDECINFASVTQEGCPAKDWDHTLRTWCG